MLIGEYKHTLDPKKRISLPAKFRKEIGRKIVITHGLDNCLFVYPMKGWLKLTEALAKLPLVRERARRFNRFMLGGAVEVDVDSIGRVLIPDFLKDFAGLKESVIVAGVNDRLEIWDESRWVEYKKQSEKEADSLAEALGDIGAF
jgi:MraZ protein